MIIKRILPLLVAFMLPSQGSCQKIDSLKLVLNSAHGEDRSAILLQLAEESSENNDYQEYLEYAKQGYENALRYNDTLNILKGTRMVGQAFRYLANLTESLKAYQSISAIIEKETVNDVFHDEYLRVLFGMALTYTYLADYDQALKYEFRSLELSQKAKKGAIERLILNNVGFTYFKLKDYDRAIEYFLQSLSVRNAPPSEDNWNHSMINTAVSYAFLGEYDSAKRTMDRIFQKCGGGCNPSTYMHTNFIHGVIQFSLKQKKKAETAFLRSYQLAEQEKNLRMQFDNIVYLIQIYLEENRLAEAKTYLQKAEGLITPSASFNLELIKIYARFFQYYGKVNDYRLKSFYQDKYISLKDSVYNEELTINLMKVEGEYLERQNSARIAAQEQVLVLNQEVIQKQRQINLFVGCIAALLIGVALLLLKNNRQKHLVNLVLNDRVRERTLALEEDHAELRKQVDQRDLLIDRVSQEMKGCIASLKGICSTGLKEITEPKTRVYMLQVRETSARIANVLKSIDRAGMPFSMKSVLKNGAEDNLTARGT